MSIPTNPQTSHAFLPSQHIQVQDKHSLLVEQKGRKLNSDKVFHMDRLS